MRWLRDMTPVELSAAIEEGRPLLLAAGCVECHGNHLPLGTDTIIAEAVAREVAARCDGVVAPTIDYGPTGYAVSGSDRGTVDVVAEAFYAYAKAALGGLVRLGFRSVFVIVHHQGPDGPEAAAFHFAGAALFNELSADRGPGWWGEREPRPSPTVRVVATIPPEIEGAVRGDHAGRTETSLLLHLSAERVDLQALRVRDFWYNWSPGQESRSATAQLGRDIFESMVAAVERVVSRPAGT